MSYISKSIFLLPLIAIIFSNTSLIKAQLKGSTSINYQKKKNGDTNFEVDVDYNISINHDASSMMHNGNLVQISPTWRVDEENFSYHYQGEDYLLRLFPAYQFAFNPYTSSTKPNVEIVLLVNYAGKSVEVFSGALSAGHHPSSLLTPSLQDNIRNYIDNGGNAEVELKIKSVTFKTQQFENSINALLNKLKYIQEASRRSTPEKNITERYYKEIMNPNHPGNVSVFASDLKNLPVVRAVAEEIIRKQEAIMQQTQSVQNSDNNDLSPVEQTNNSSTYTTNTIHLGTSTSSKVTDENRQAASRHTQQGNALWDAGKYSEAQQQWEQALAIDPNNQAAKSNLEQVAQIISKNEEIIASMDYEFPEFLKSSSEPKDVDTAIEEAAYVLGEAIGSGALDVDDVLAGAGIVGAGMLMTDLLMNSKSRTVVNYNNKVSMKKGVFYGQTKDNWPVRGRFEFSNGDNFNGSFYTPITNRKINKPRVLLKEGTLQFSIYGHVFKGKMHYYDWSNGPKEGTLTYADNGVFKGQFHKDKKQPYTWKYGEYTTPDQRLRLRGVFNKEHGLANGFISYYYPDGHHITWEVNNMVQQAPTITFLNGHQLRVSLPDKKNELHAYTYLTKTKGSKKLELEVRNPTLCVQQIESVGGKENTAEVLAYISRSINDETLKENYYQKALSHAPTSEIKQAIINQQQHATDLTYLTNKWKYYARLLKYNTLHMERIFKDSHYHTLSAIQCINAKQVEKAQNHIEEANKYADNETKKSAVNLYFAFYYLQNNQYEKALPYAQQSYTHTPEHAYACGGLARCYYGIGQYDKSISYAQKAMALQPIDKGWGYYIALSTLCKKDYKQAQKHYKKYQAKYGKAEKLTAIRELQILIDKGEHVDEAHYIIENILN
ncbi:tetratricopeptide repeat protein [Carboxylicivirga marina]|uniref:tetratricopeptide repeat protein n=1 Tax=Carboxylicivirga marina TaxID=2800988 RepID=UPI00259A2346|nr:tetratricopeptide repeat protein [uncultured Carboxylicivirga sp.]